MSVEEPIKIYQSVLDAVSDAVLKGDSTTVNAYLAKPFHMRTINGWFPLNTPEDIEHMVRTTHFSLKVQGATDYVRIAHSAELCDDGSIEGSHITHILRNSTPLVPSYESRMTLKNLDGTWRVTVAKHAMDNSKWPVSTPRINKGDLAAIDNSAELDDIAMRCYQDFLDNLTAVNISGKFDDWIEACEFPHKVQIDRVDRLIETPDDIRAFFDMLTNLLNDNPDATFVRRADFAGFLDSHTLRGYHTTTLKSKDNEAIPPVRSRMTARFSNGKWRMIEVVNSIANTEFPYAKPIVSDHMASEFQYHMKVN